MKDMDLKMDTYRVKRGFLAKDSFKKTVETVETWPGGIKKIYHCN
jgi:hypothetical protein